MIGFWADFFTFLQVAIGLFLIFIIMLQRGKGGGLVGALGGMGGASAFGPKADIQVLKLTIGLAIAWVVIACVGIFFNRSYAGLTYNPVGDNAGVKKDAESKDSKDKSGTKDEGKTEPSGKTEPADKTKGPSLEPQAGTKAEADADATNKAEPKSDAKAEKEPEEPAKESTPVEKPATETKPDTKK